MRETKEEKILNKEIKCILPGRRLNGCSPSCQKTVSSDNSSRPVASIVQLSGERTKRRVFISPPLWWPHNFHNIRLYSGHCCLHSILHQRSLFHSGRRDNQCENVVAWKNISSEHVDAGDEECNRLSSIALTGRQKFIFYGFSPYLRGLNCQQFKCCSGSRINWWSLHFCKWQTLSSVEYFRKLTLPLIRVIKDVSKVHCMLHGASKNSLGHNPLTTMFVLYGWPLIFQNFLRQFQWISREKKSVETTTRHPRTKLNY